MRNPIEVSRQEQSYLNDTKKLKIQVPLIDSQSIDRPTPKSSKMTKDVSKQEQIEIC